MNEWSHWQCFLLYLISFQERESKHQLSLIFNTKSNLENKQAKTSFI